MNKNNICYLSILIMLSIYAVLLKIIYSIMKIKIIVVGKSVGENLISLELEFEKRLKYYCKIDYIIIP